MGMQNASRKTRNGRITGRGEQTREAGTDVSWRKRNGVSVQQIMRSLAQQPAGGQDE
ncbi:hypothetical protein SNOG_10098 [Parastagonospora nodorum SN15]|uniref:Uncharacterized protein n=1 Tax=Phaeosphaeria nodorum (strain SN15 / ATCC MYA-4574 / FGSC 10173) TaxID=321614 RepID=Q0UDR6_PHANO|nr:hypothetical protein SNOG_10098 [Parastagonospora nodorum SN15]EAT82433.1 hypothetical protein SNOG_10098 [Parastagonospora nodorum SN15]